MSNFGAPPVIPTQLQIYKYVLQASRSEVCAHDTLYSSYIVDPKWQRKFSIVWAVAIAIAVVASAPRLWHSLRTGSAYKSLFGVTEHFNASGKYSPVAPSLEKGTAPSRRRSGIFVLAESALSMLRWTIPGIELDFGQSKHTPASPLSWQLTAPDQCLSSLGISSLCLSALR